MKLNEKRSSFLAADQISTPICPCSLTFNEELAELVNGDLAAVDKFIEVPVESETRTYHGRVGSGRPAERPGGVGQDRVPTELFAQKTKVYRTLQQIVEMSLQRLSRSTNKRNPM